MDTCEIGSFKGRNRKSEYAFHHNKILKVLVKNNIKYSENRNGIFVNMNSFDESINKEIEKSLLYIKNQEKSLQDIETIKEEINKDYFENDNKDKNTVILSHGSIRIYQLALNSCKKYEFNIENLKNKLYENFKPISVKRDNSTKKKEKKCKYFVPQKRYLFGVI